MILFAQNGGWSWLSIFSQINLWGLIAIIAICGAATDIVRRVLQHRERIAMIQAGMNPSESSAANDD